MSVNGHVTQRRAPEVFFDFDSWGKDELLARQTSCLHLDKHMCYVYIHRCVDG